MTPDVTILIPAAGASSRMRGRDKLLELVGGETALHRAARLALASGARAVVTLPDSGPHSVARRSALSGLRCQVLPVRDYQDGLSASIRAGAAAAGMSPGLMVLMPDMPDIGEADIASVLRAFARDPSNPVRGTTEDGRPGHPVILPRRLYPGLLVLTGDRGAQPVLEGEPVQSVVLPGLRAITDLDTPEQWDNWHSDG
jgi:CTP:molybdopterin cytidylyltransferase MocA